MVVDPFDAHPAREFHNLYNSLHRFGQKLRQRRGLRTRPCFSGNYFFPDSRLRQCAIPRTHRRESWDDGFSTAATCVAVSRTEIVRSSERISLVLPLPIHGIEVPPCLASPLAKARGFRSGLLVAPLNGSLPLTLFLTKGEATTSDVCSSRCKRWNVLSPTRWPGPMLTDWGQSVPPSACYDFTQFGLRFSLKAAMPSRASSDSRACM